MNTTIRKLKRLFSSQSEARIRAAFSAIKHDIKSLDYDQKALDAHQESLKDSTNEWVVYLDQENTELKERVRDLERQVKRLNSLNSQKSRETEASLSVLETV